MGRHVRQGDCPACGQPYKGRSPDFLHRACYLGKARQTGKKKPPPDHPKPLMGTITLAEVSWREWLPKLKETVDLTKKARPVNVYKSIPIETDRPIGVMLTACWHVGSLHCDYALMERDWRFLLETPRLYTGIAGDESDNFPASFRSAAAVFSQIIAPDIQLGITKNFFEEMASAGKILFALGGNHGPEREEKLLGWSPTAYLLSQKVPFFTAKAIIELIVGEQSYTILGMHNTHFRSYLNDLHGNKQEWRQFFPADVVVAAHTHRPAFELFWRYSEVRRRGFGLGGDCYAVKAGTYKDDCVYSMRGWERGIYGNPTLVFHPQTRLIVPFKDPRLAAIYLRGYEEIGEEMVDILVRAEGLTELTTDNPTEGG